MAILVTGGTGTIGSLVIAYLTAKGAEVLSLNASAALTTMKAGLGTRSCALSRR